MGELVPANGTASHFLLFQNISIPLPKTNEPGYTRRTNSPSRGVLASGKEPIGIGRKLMEENYHHYGGAGYCGFGGVDDRHPIIVGESRI